MPFRGYRARGLIISVLLMMVCVQSFSMHFHLADGEDDHRPHAHTHAHGSTDADHFTTEHADEVSSDLTGALTKQSFVFDLFVFAIIGLFSISLANEHSWSAVHGTRPGHRLLFLRPPLRAPPV